MIDLLYYYEDISFSNFSCRFLNLNYFFPIPPQVLGYQLTLFGPGGQIMPAILLVPPHLFERSFNK